MSWDRGVHRSYGLSQGCRNKVLLKDTDLQYLFTTRGCRKTMSSDDNAYNQPLIGTDYNQSVVCCLELNLNILFTLTLVVGTENEDVI